MLFKKNIFNMVAIISKVLLNGLQLNVEDYRGAVIANTFESTFIISKVCFPHM